MQEQMGDRRDRTMRTVAQVPYGQLCRAVSHENRWKGGDHKGQPTGCRGAILKIEGWGNKKEETENLEERRW